MTIYKYLDFASIDDLYLDPLHPRLGQCNISKHTAQEEILERIRGWVLEELAFSFLKNGGFWTYEPLIVIEEKLYGKPRLIVVEGNRRLAALKYLRDAYGGEPVSDKWKSMVTEFPNPSSGLFSKVPYILVSSREEVQSFIGFRHITGVKQWYAEEKAGFIAWLIDKHGMTYDEVGHQIGMRTPSVRRHYIAYRVLLQIKNVVEEFDLEHAENRFILLYFSIDTEGAKQYLQIDMMADPQLAKNPVPNSHLRHLTNFSRWLFGTNEQGPLIIDTNQVSDFGKILESRDAIAYLEQTPNPKFYIALRRADEDTIIRLVEEAAHNLELALSQADNYKNSPRVQQIIQRLNGFGVFTP